MILLDTCSLLWIAADQTRLSETAKRLLASNSDELFVSSVSAFELARLHQDRAIELPLEPYEWFQKTVQFHGFHELPVTGEYAALAAGLPPLHEDLCDRILIATALARGMTILSPDPALGQYPQAQTIF